MIDKDVQEKRLKQGAELGKNDVFLLETRLLMLLGRTAGCIEDHSSFTGVAVRMLESLLQWYGSKPGYAAALQRSLRTRAGLGAECKPEHSDIFAKAAAGGTTLEVWKAKDKATVAMLRLLESWMTRTDSILLMSEVIIAVLQVATSRATYDKLLAAIENGCTVEKANPAKASGTGNLSGALIDCEMPEDDTKRSCANSDCVHFDGSPICPGCDRIETPSTVACPHVDCHNFKILKNSGAW